jgi:hypothetical protein
MKFSYSATLNLLGKIPLSQGPDKILLSNILAVFRASPTGVEPVFYTLSECSLIRLDDSDTIVTEPNRMIKSYSITILNLFINSNTVLIYCQVFF